MRRQRVVYVGPLFLIIICGPGLIWTRTVAGQQAPRPFLTQRTTNQPPAGINKINHVIWIIQENRSFDNYFGTFPGADGIPPKTCLPDLPGSKSCVAPFHMPKGGPPVRFASYMAISPCCL